MTMTTLSTTAAAAAKCKSTFLLMCLAAIASSSPTLVVSAENATLAPTTECTAYLPPAVIKGKKFFLSTTGEYLPIKGINYYPRPNTGALTMGNSQDYFTEAFRYIWERDIYNFKALNINAVQLYAVDPGQDHDAFMCALQQAGIYVLVGLMADCEKCALLADQTAPDCYPVELKRRGEYIIQQFSKYENVIGFSAGNDEVTMQTMPCQKQFLRDMRAYVQKCSANSMRQIPVGLAIADQDRDFKALYYRCNSDPTTDVEGLQVPDFLGINAYLDCNGNATTMQELVGYDMLLQDAISYDLPMPFLWTEYGCPHPGLTAMSDGVYDAKNNFLQTEALYSAEFRQEFAGGFVFEYSTEQISSDSKGNYGLGFFEPEDCNDIDVACAYVRYPQFDVLAAQYAAVSIYVADEGDMESYQWDFGDINADCPISGDGSATAPLDSFLWSTLSEEGTVCPDLTGPLIASETPATPPPDNNATATNTTEPEQGLGSELDGLLQENDAGTSAPSAEALYPLIVVTMQPTASAATLTPTVAPTAIPEVLVSSLNTTNAPSMATSQETTMADTYTATMISTAMESVAETFAVTEDLVTQAPSAATTREPTSVPTLTPLGGSSQVRDSSQIQAPTSSATAHYRHQALTCLWMLASSMVVGAALDLL